MVPVLVPATQGRNRRSARVPWPARAPNLTAKFVAKFGVQLGKKVPCRAWGRVGYSGGPKKSPMPHVGECGVSEKKKARVRAGGPRVGRGVPTREGGGVYYAWRTPLPHEKISTAFPSTMGTLFRLILTKMAYPHMDTKIPLRVVFPLPHLRVGNPYA